MGGDRAGRLVYPRVRMARLAVTGVTARLVVILRVIVARKPAKRCVDADAGRETGQLRAVDGRELCGGIELNQGAGCRAGVERRRRAEAERRACRRRAGVVDQRGTERGYAVRLRQCGVSSDSRRRGSGRIIDARVGVVACRDRCLLYTSRCV